MKNILEYFAVCFFGLIACQIFGFVLGVLGRDAMSPLVISAVTVLGFPCWWIPAAIMIFGFTSKSRQITYDHTLFRVQFVKYSVISWLLVVTVYTGSMYLLLYKHALVNPLIVHYGENVGLAAILWALGTIVYGMSLRDRLARR